MAYDAIENHMVVGGADPEAFYGGRYEAEREPAEYWCLACKVWTKVDARCNGRCGEVEDVEPE